MGIKLKRFLSMALAVLMVFSMVPVTALAADGDVIIINDDLTDTVPGDLTEPIDGDDAEAITVKTQKELVDALATANEITVEGDISIDEELIIPESVTLTVNEGYTLRVLAGLTNNGQIVGDGRVAVSVMVYVVSTEKPYADVTYDITATKNGAITGTAPACAVAYEISLDGGKTWITDTTGGKAQAVTVKTNGTTVVSASFQSAFTSALTGEVVHMLKDAHVQSTNTKKNNGPLRSYYGLILEGNGHTIYTDLESSGASNEYATIKFTSYLAGTGPEVNPVLKNVTIDSQNNAKADLDYVSGDVIFTVTMYNVNLLGNCQYASFAMKSPSMIINKSAVELYDVEIPSWDAGSAKAIDLYSGDYSVSLNSKCTVYGGTYQKDVSAYLADGFKIQQNEDGSYGVEVIPVAKIGEKGYKTLAEAIAAANDMTNEEVTIEIYGKAEYTAATENLTGSYNTINFVGMTEDAEISLTRNGSGGYISGNGNDCTVNFTNLTLSKPEGYFANDAGFMNCCFTVYRVKAVNYTDCYFANGAAAAGCPTTYTDCTFKRSHDKYGLWAYGNTEVTVDECVFDDYRGIKMYAEGAAKTTELTVKNTDFSAVTDKPAIVLTYGESITLEGNTYSNTGVLELDKDGAPNGTPITADITNITCVNDDGACGVLVDGKIYTTITDAAKVATEGSNVTLMYDTDETVKLAIGVTLNKNGHTADSVTVATPVAMIGDKSYATLAEAITAVQNSDIKIIELVADATISDTTYGYSIDGITINGNGKTVTVTNCGEGYDIAYLFKGNGFKVNNLILDLSSDTNKNLAGFSMGENSELNNVTINEGYYNVWLPAGTNAKLTGCTFIKSDVSTAAIYNESATEATIDGCTFNAARGATLQAGVTFTNNTVGSNNGSSKGITFAGAATVTGNTFNARLSIHNTEVTVEKNKILGALELDGDAVNNSSNLNLSSNYWGTDNQEEIFAKALGATVGSYYTDAELTNLIVLPSGTITPCYTRNDGFWGEGTSNSKESFVVELYEGDNKIASASLNNVDGIINGNLYVTWSIPFDGSTDEYWDVEWATGYPKYDMNPDKMVLVVDGTQVATNNVQYNGPDNLNKIVALAEGFTGGVKAYTSLADAMGNFNGRKVNVLRDVTESIEGFYGATLTTNVEGGVTITNTNAEDWIDFDDVVVGKGVTVNIPNVYSGDSENTILGTLNVGETYYHGYDAKTTIKDGGKVTVGDSTILRYNESADAGIYIYGDGDDSTVEFDCDYYIGSYSGTFYAENANVEAGYFLLKNSYDNDDYANIDMTLNNSSLTVVGTNDGQDSFIIDDKASLTLENGASINDVRDFNILTGAKLEMSVDETSSISATYVSIAEDVPLAANKNEDGTVSFRKALAGAGTVESPYLINNLEELQLFRDEVDAGNQYTGKYVKLTADIDLKDINWEPIGSGIEDKRAFQGTFDGGNNTIYNLYIEQNGSYLGFFAATGHFNEGTVGTVVKNITFENVTVKTLNNGNYIGAVIANSRAYTTIENVKVTGNIDIAGRGYVGGIVGHGYLKANNCHVEGTGTIDSSFWCCGGILGYGGEGSTNITNCSVTGIGEAGLTIQSVAGGVASIVGMAEDNEGTQPCTGTELSASNVKIATYGEEYASYKEYALGYIFGGSEISNLTDIKIEEVTFDAAGNTNPPVNDAVAQIGKTVYFSLQDAIDAVQEGKTITLLRNVTITEGANGSSNGISYTRGASFTLDLNGKTISSNLGNNALRFKIGDGTTVAAPVTVTIKNGKVVSGADNWCAISASGTSETASLTMNLEDLTVEANKGGDFAIKSWEYAVVNAKNVTVTGNYAGGFYAVGGEIVLDDCTVTQIGMHTAPYNSMAFGVSDGGMMTINSGNYSTEPKTAADGYNQGSSHGSWVGGIMNSGGTLIINGGTFSNGNYGDDSLATAARGLLFVDTGATLEINGGEFNALKGIIDYQNNLGDASKNPAVDIYGGTFSAPIDEKYCGDGYVPTEISEGVYGVKAANEAMIFRNGRPKYYSTLAAAIADAKEGETVVLQASVIIGEKIAINKNLTISDYGSLTISFIGNGGFSITNNAEVVIEQCNIDISDAVAKGDCIIGIGDNSNNAKLTLNEVNIVGDNYSSAYAVFYVYNTSELNIVDSNINLSNDNATYADGSHSGGFIKAEQGADGIVNITDSVINLTDAQIGFLNGTVKIEGTELTINGGDNAINQSALTVIDSTLTIKNCDGRALTLYQGDVTIKNSTLDFSGASEGEIRFKKALNLNVDEDSTITECTIYADVSSGATVNGETVTGTETYKSTISAADGTTTLVNPDWAAKIGETYYITLAEAVATGGTVVLQRDIELAETITVAAGNTVVLDLNGKTITGTDNNTSGNFYLFNNRGTLTIKDSGTNGKITLTATNDRDFNASSVVIANNPGGNLTVESGTIEHQGGSDMAYALDNLTNGNQGNVTMTINDGTIKSTYRAIRQFLNSTTDENVLTINGGTIESDGYAVFVHDPNTKANNGTITIGEGATVNGDVYLFVTAGSTEWPVNVSIAEKALGENSVTTKNVPVGYELIVIDGTYCVKNGIAKIGTDYYPSLKDALDAAANSENIVIDLIADASYDISAWEAYAMGGENTKTVTINGNDYTLTFNKKNSDWNHIVTNNDAKLILNDMTITDSGYNNGPWNRYDINFGCDVELNNVTSSKALAFKADAALNGVIINESGDNYAIWIQANGQNVAIDGLTINSAGRGIKIDEQYVDAENVASVNLGVKNATFTTAKKAAILVKSVAGAKIIAENVNIAGVADDSTNIVWVDEDSANVFGNVTINGENAVMESADKFYASAISNGVFGYYKTLAEALAAADDDSTVTLIADVVLSETLTFDKEGTYTIDGNGYSIKPADGYVTNNCAIMLGATTSDDSAIESHNYTIKNIVFDGWTSQDVVRTQGVELLVNGCTFQNTNQTTGQAILRMDYTEATVMNTIFKGNNALMAITHNFNDSNENPSNAKLTIEECVFENNVFNKTAAIYYVNGGGCTINDSEFIKNTVNCNTNGAIIYLGFQENCAVTGCLFEENSVKDSSTSTRVAGAIFTGYESDISGNAFVNNSAANANGSEGLAQDVCVSTYYTNIDLSGNYWCGVEPVLGKNYFVQHTDMGYVMDVIDYYKSYSRDEDGNVVLSEMQKIPAGDLQYAGYVGTSGEIGTESYRENIQIDMYDVYAEESLVVKMYSNGTLISTTSRREADRDDENAKLFPVDGTTTANIVVYGRLSGSWDTEWHVAPSVAYLPDTIEVYADGRLVGTFNGGFTNETEKNEYMALSGVFKIAVVTDANGNVVSYYATLADALAAAKSGETVTVIDDIEITESLTVPSGVTVTSEEGVVITTDVHHAFVLSDGAVLDGLTIDQPTVSGAVNTIYMNSNSQVINSKVTGQYGINENDTTCRAIEVAPGATGVTISGNTFQNLRQPAYANNDCTGTIANNYVDGTRGWVICSDSNMTITGNTFGENAVDICIIASGNTDNYAGKTVELSKNNNYAYVENQVQSVLADNGVLVAKDTKTLQGAIKEAKNGDIITIIADGTYKLPGFSKALTIKAAEDSNVVIDNGGAVALSNAKVTFENLTFDYYPNVNYTGLQHVDTVTYNNCTINGQVFLYGNVETFNNCTFNQNSADAYNVWTYGADKVLFNDCTFNSVGKSVLIYSEEASLYNDVEFVDCELNASAPVEGKAAIEMDSSLTAGIKLTIDDETTATGFDDGNVSGNSLWNNKKGTEGVNNDITVIVNEEIVLQPIKTAQIGNLYYTTLDAAIEAATNGQTIILLTYIEVDETVVLNKAITLDLNKNTISSSDNINVIEITDNATIKNGTVSGYRTGNTNGVVKVNSGALTLDTVKLVNTGTSYNLRALRVQSGGSATLINCDVTGFISGLGTTEIQSGTYANCEASDYNVLDGAGIAVSGGTFGYVIEVIDCAEGYKPLDNGNGTWTVTNSTFAEDLTIRDYYDLQLFRDMVDAGDNFSGKTVKLDANIDLGNVAWNPIGKDENTLFSGTFDGAGYTISNLNIGNGNNMGFFGAVQNATIKNLTVDNASVITQGTGVGVIVGRSFGNSNFENLNVTGLVKVEGLNYVGGIVGYAYGHYTNCSVDVDAGSYAQVNAPEHKCYVGGIAGWNGEGACNFVDCSVNNITLKALSSDGAHSYGIGGLVGLAQAGNTIENCSVTNVTIEAGEATMTGTIVGANNGTASAPVMLINNTATAVTVTVDGIETEVGVIGTHNTNFEVTELTIIGTDVEKDDAGKFTAGTFNVEVDSYCAEGYDSIADGDVYIIVEKGTVAKFNDVCYSDLTDALDAATKAGGGTVTMYDDYTEMFVMIDDSVTLDLNGHGLTITGRMLAAFGDVIDSTDGEGGLYVGINDAVVLQADNGGYMPIYDSVNGCYRFYTYTLQNLTPQYSGTDVVTYGYRLRFSNVDAYNLLINAIDDSNFEMMVKLSWSTEGNMNAPLTYTIPNEYISTFASTAARQLTNNGNVTAAITFKVTGLSSLAPDTTVSTSVTAQSGTGVKTESDNKNVVTAANTVTE